MIVPLTYFTEKPFQNWTREGSALIGSAFFHLDYRAPVGVIRDKLNEIVKGSKDWNGQVATFRTPTPRRANSAGQAFDLRCEVREKNDRIFAARISRRPAGAARDRRGLDDSGTSAAEKIAKRALNTATVSEGVSERDNFRRMS